MGWVCCGLRLGLMAVEWLLSLLLVLGYCDLFTSVGLCCWYCAFCGVRAGRLVFWWLLCYWFGLLYAVLSYCLTSVAFSLWWGL